MCLWLPPLLRLRPEGGLAEMPAIATENGVVWHLMLLAPRLCSGIKYWIVASTTLAAVSCLPMGD